MDIIKLEVLVQVMNTDVTAGKTNKHEKTKKYTQYTIMKMVR